MTRRRTALSAVLICLLAPGVASAMTDFGSEYFVLRFAADSAHVLLAECDEQCTEPCTLKVVNAQGKVIESVSLKGIGPSDNQYENYCFAQSDTFQWYFDTVSAASRIKKLRSNYGFTELPKSGELSPDNSRFVFVGERKGKQMARLIEGKKAQWIGPRWKDLGDDEYNTTTVAVKWSPDGRMVVAAGKYLSKEDAPDFHWTPLYMVYAFEGSAKEKLDKHTVAEELNSQGFRYYKASKNGKDFAHQPGIWYARALEWDPAYETAIYNRACMLALEKKRDEAFKYLRKLRNLGTKRARELLPKARKDRDFQRYYKHPKFIELTQ